MMALRLEDFDGVHPKAPEPESVPDAGYDAGYEQGQTDALASVEAARDAAISDAAQRLADFDLTFSEASQALLQGLKPLFVSICDALLPSIAAEALGQQLVAVLAELADEQISTAELRLCADDHELIAAVLEASNADVTLSADANLAPGQVLLVCPDSEKMVDMTRATETVRAALLALVHETERMSCYG